jgi:hypothetical protein
MTIELTPEFATKMLADWLSECGDRHRFYWQMCQTVRREANVERAATVLKGWFLCEAKGYPLNSGPLCPFAPDELRAVFKKVDWKAVARAVRGSDDDRQMWFEYESQLCDSEVTC